MFVICVGIAVNDIFEQIFFIRFHANRKLYQQMGNKCQLQN